MFRGVVWSQSGVDIVVMDSLSQVEDGDHGAIVVAASNGGRESGVVGAHARCAFILLNDAGIGKDGAGVAGLEILAQSEIPAAAVSHMTAEISNGMDMWENGVISTVNGPAYIAGVRTGQPAQTSLIAFAEELARPRGGAA